MIITLMGGNSQRGQDSAYDLLRPLQHPPNDPRNGDGHFIDPLYFRESPPTDYPAYSGPFFSWWIFMAFCISDEMIMEGSMPVQAACSKKKEEGAIPEDELGSVMRILPPSQ